MNENGRNRINWALSGIGIIIGIAGIILNHLGIFNITDIIFLAFIVVFVLLAITFMNTNNFGKQLNQSTNLISTKVDASTDFTFSLNGILAKNNLITSQDVDTLYKEHYEKLKTILTAPNNPLNADEGKDYNELMRKLNENIQMDSSEIERLRSYLEREKKDAEAKNNTDALFAIIIALGLVAILAGLLLSKK